MSLATDGYGGDCVHFLTYPSIRLYRAGDAPTDSLPQIDLYGVADPPTGMEITLAYFPAWIISLAAVPGLLLGIYGLQSETPGRRT